MTVKRLALSVEEAAEMLGISRRTVYDLLRSNSLRSVKIGSRRLIRQTDLEQFLADLGDAA